MSAEKQPIPVGSAKIDCIGTYGPATWANVLYAVPTTIDPAHLQDVVALCVDAAHDFYNTAINVAQLATGWTLDRVRVVFRDAEDSVYRATIADAAAGSGGGGEAAQVAYLVNWQTGDPRKGGKPRQYVPGVRTANLTDSVRLDPSITAAINARIVTWITDNLTRAHGTATGVVFGEMSFRNAKTWRDTPLFYPAIAGTISAEVATQRRRVDRLRT